MFFILSFLFFSSMKSKSRKPELVMPREEDWHLWEGEDFRERG
jgi:hypothetical protein